MLDAGWVGPRTGQCIVVGEKISPSTRNQTPVIQPIASQDNNK